MELHNETLLILKNFAEINSGLIFKEGKTLSTISQQRNVLAVAQLVDEFPQTFAIHDLNNFLSVLSMHKDDVELDFDKHHVLIVGRKGKSKIKYRFADPTMIIAPPEKGIKLPSTEVKFDLSSTDLEWVANAARVLSSPHVAVVGEQDSGKVCLMTFDAKKDDAHREYLELDIAAPEDFTLTFSTDNFNKLILTDYVVEVSAKGLAKFDGSKRGIVYHMALEQKESSFNGKTIG